MRVMRSLASARAAALSASSSFDPSPSVPVSEVALQNPATGYAVHADVIDDDRLVAPDNATSATRQRPGEQGVLATGEAEAIVEADTAQLLHLSQVE